ncbi:hypothetical protein GQ55_1G051000 [Panicum hallii var. hallii]|uniref:Uncharacterized protein n=1 Tax=Panicum hallii var. hallii TaxID=1504633 RepID=A0A2T7F2F4_9POAL|nr:hypothetical protein GQ55_1G051000 [Panicum hallii var. hallii]
MVCRRVELLSSFAVSWRCEKLQGQASTGCIPGRCFFEVTFTSSMMGFCCGSFQRLQAMVLCLISVYVPLMAGSGVRLRGGDGSQHLEMYLAGSEDLVVVLSLIFSRVLCVSWVEQLLCAQSDLPKAQPGYLCLELIFCHYTPIH